MSLGEVLTLGLLGLCGRLLHCKDKDEHTDWYVYGVRILGPVNF